MSRLSDIGPSAIASVLKRLKAMAQPPVPTVADLATEEARLKLAERVGRHSVVLDLEAALMTHERKED